VINIFSTQFVIIFGAFFGLAYILILIFTKRTTNINVPDIGGVFFSSSSIIGGLKLICTTIILLNDKATSIETDKVYTIYGGFCVIYISFRTLYSKIKTENSPPTK